MGFSLGASSILPGSQRMRKFLMCPHSVAGPSDGRWGCPGRSLPRCRFSHFPSCQLHSPPPHSLYLHGEAQGSSATRPNLIVALGTETICRGLFSGTHPAPSSLASWLPFPPVPESRELEQPGGGHEGLLPRNPFRGQNSAHCTDHVLTVLTPQQPYQGISAWKAVGRAGQGGDAWANITRQHLVTFTVVKPEGHWQTHSPRRDSH